MCASQGASYSTAGDARGDLGASSFIPQATDDSHRQKGSVMIGDVTCACLYGL